MRCKGNAFILFLQVFRAFFRKKLKYRRKIGASFSGRPNRGASLLTMCTESSFACHRNITPDVG